MANYEKDFQTVTEILSKQTITNIDRMILLSIYQTPYHDTGKIEGFTSCDSSCNGCTFCQKMRESNKDNKLCICNYCYDNEQEQRWKNVKNRHSLNLLIISSVLFEEEELATLNIGLLNRFNSSGDIENIIQARNYIRIAKSHQLTFNTLFAKNTSPVIEATDIEGKPENIIYIQSSPIIGKPCKLAKYFDFTFTVYPDEQTTLEAIKAGSGECNGKKCKFCKKCYLPEKLGGWKKGTNIAELLRLKSKKQLEEILNEYYQ